MITSHWVQNRISHNLIKYVVFPILLALKIKNLELYDKIVCGKAKESFISIMISNNKFLEVIKSATQDIPEQDMDIKLLLNDLYDNLFIKANVNYDTMMMNGKICIEQINVNTLKMMLSFINDIITLS